MSERPGGPNGRSPRGTSRGLPALAARLAAVLAALPTQSASRGTSRGLPALAARLAAVLAALPTQSASRGTSRGLPALAARVAALLRALPASLADARRRRAIFRAEVAEESMSPVLLPGDWLLVDPTVREWPRRGSIVVIREPDTGILAVKRVAARSGDHVRIPEGYLHLAADEAWLVGDNSERSLDSRRYGPVEVEALVARVWFRYWPPGRIGPP